MPLTATCPNCSARYRLGDELAGKTVTCKKCNNRFVVQATGANGGGTSTGDSAARPKPTKPREDEGDLDFNRDEDRPAKKKGGSGKILLIIGGILFAVTLFCCGPAGYGIWWFYGRAQKGVLEFNDALKKEMERQQKGGAFNTNGPVNLNGPAIKVSLGPDGSNQTNSTLNAADQNTGGRVSKLFEVNLDAGKTYTIEMQGKAPGFDPLLRLHGPDGQKVAEDDDGGGALNSKIVFPAQRAGTYKIQATTMLGPPFGDFALTIRRQ